MLEIIAIVYFSRIIGNKARDKGYSKGWYIFFFVLFWLVGEVIGAIIGQLLAAGMIIYLFAILGAGLGGFAAYLIVNNLKDKSNNEEMLDSNLI